MLALTAFLASRSKYEQPFSLCDDLTLHGRGFDGTLTHPGVACVVLQTVAGDGDT